MRPIWTAITALAFLTCFSCSEQPQQTGKQEAGKTTTRQQTDDGYCSLVSKEEFSQAFNGLLPLGEMQSSRTGCSVAVMLGDGGQLGFNMLSKGNFDVYKAQQGRSGITFEELPGLGEDAFILNNAQVCVKKSANEFFLVGLQLILFQQELPVSLQQSRAGLIEIAEKLVQRL